MDHSNSSKNATKTSKKRIFWTTNRVNIIITPITSKKASTTRLEELAAPLTYIPKANPKSHNNLTGIVNIVNITDNVSSTSLLSDCSENVYPIKNTQQYHKNICAKKNKKNL